MQNINPKLLETLKQRNIGINLNGLNKGAPTRNKTPEKASRRDSSPMDSGINSMMGSTSSKFRVRNIPSGNNEEAMMRSSFTKTTNKLPPRPGTATKTNPFMQTAPSQTSLHKGRPMTSQSGRSMMSSKGPFMRSESTRMSDDEDNNEINFVNMDEDNELEERVREELEIFNDIADLNDMRLAEIINVDVDMLNKVTRAEMKVDLSFNSLQYAGELLQSLRQLKLNNSIIGSLRDIGNSFKNLEILWISKCGMKDLAGLSSFPKLQELYAPYNNIKDLSDIIFHSHLQVLDLEGNEIEKLETLENLMSLEKLNTLTISSNPICKNANYEHKVFEILPNLEVLNDIFKDEVTIQNTQNGTQKNNEQGFDDERIREIYSRFEKLKFFPVEDFEENTRQVILKDMAKEPSEEDIIMMSVKKTAKKFTNAQDPDDFGKFSMKATSKKSKGMHLQRPQTSKPRIGAKGSSIFSDMDRLSRFGHEASDLIHQTDEAFAGNPLKALRHRRKNQFTAGFENFKGENITKPKDIMKLIEEFEVNRDSEDEENKNSEMSVSVPSSQHLDSEGDMRSYRSNTQPENTEPQPSGRANSLMQVNIFFFIFFF